MSCISLDSRVNQNSYLSIPLAIGAIIAVGGIFITLAAFQVLPQGVNVISHLGQLGKGIGYSAMGGGFLLFVGSILLSVRKCLQEDRFESNEFSTNIKDVSLSSRMQKTHSMGIAQSTSFLEDVYTTLFPLLGGQALLNAGRVCKQWKYLADTPSLWEKIFQTEIMFPSSYSQGQPKKQMFLDAKRLPHLMTANKPKRHALPGIERVDYLTKDTVLVSGSRVYRKDIHYKKRKYSVSVWENFGPQGICIKQIILPFEPSILRIVKDTLFCVEAYHPREVVKYDLKKIGMGPLEEVIGEKEKIKFAVEDWYDDRSDTPFLLEFSETHAFNSREDGSICVMKMLTGASFNAEDEKVSLNDPQESSYTFLEGHEDKIMVLQVIGNYLFSASKDYRIKKWDLSTHECLFTILGGFSRQGGGSVLFSERYILTSSSYGIELYDSQSGKLIREIESDEGMCDEEQEDRTSIFKEGVSVVGNILLPGKAPLIGEYIYDLETGKRFKTLEKMSSEASIKKLSYHERAKNLVNYKIIQIQGNQFISIAYKQGHGLGVYEYF